MSNPQIDNAPGKSKPELADRTERVRAVLEEFEVYGNLPECDHQLIEERLLAIIDGDAEPSDRERGAIAVLKELYSWVKNWDVMFLEDDEWPETQAKIDAILNESEVGE